MSPETGWEESIRNMREAILEIKSSQPRLRHDRPFASASLLAKQFYCEMKVEQEFLHGEVEKEEMRVGSALHEELIPMARADVEEVISEIEQEEVSMISMPMLARLGDVAIAGTPDAVVFCATRPLFLIELKTTRGRPNVWPEQWVQAQIYGFLLEGMGFDCSDLQVLVASVNQRQDIGRESFIHDLLGAVLQKETSDLETKLDCRIRMEPYDRNFAEEKIKWAVEYWLKKREAIPTDMPGKCRSCEFVELCPSSLLK